MRLLAFLLRSEETRDALEADFQQEYGIDLYAGADLSNNYRPNPTIPLRRVVALTNELPSSSRVMKYLRNDAFDQKDHLLANAVDYLSRVSFYSMVAARAAVTSSEVFDHVPEPATRPKLRQEQIEEAEVVANDNDNLPRLITGRELKEALGDGVISEKKIKRAKREQLRAQETQGLGTIHDDE